MYNSAQKKQFIQSYTNDIKLASKCEKVFDVAGAFEKKWSADLCTVAEDELRPLVEQLLGGRMVRAWDKALVLRDYIKWCKNIKHIQASDAIFHLKIHEIQRSSNMMVDSPQRLKLYLDRIFYDDDPQGTNNIYRCYFWLAFSGVREEDSIKISSKNIDPTHRVINFNDTFHPVYKESVEVFKNCMELNSFLYEHPGYPSRWRERAPGNTLLRGFKPITSTNYLRVEALRVQSRKQTKLSYRSIWLSGVFYRTYVDELSGITPDFVDVAKTCLIGDDDMSIQKVQRRAGEYLKDYNKWKFIFNL